MTTPRSTLGTVTALSTCGNRRPRFLAWTAERHRSGQERVGKRAREAGNWGCRVPNTRRILVLSAPELYPFIEARSEEHTSELQSHSDLVCRLLLEKKNDRVLAEDQVTDLVIGVRVEVRGQ